MTSGGMGWTSVGTVPELKAERGMGDRNPGLHLRGLLGWQEQRRKGVRGGDPREASAKGCDEEEGPRGVGRRPEGGRLPRCPGPKSRSRGREGTVGALGLCQVEGHPCWTQQHRC